MNDRNVEKSRVAGHGRVAAVRSSICLPNSGHSTRSPGSHQQKLKRNPDRRLGAGFCLMQYGISGNQVEQPSGRTSLSQRKPEWPEDHSVSIANLEAGRVKLRSQFINERLFVKFFEFKCLRRGIA